MFFLYMNDAFTGETFSSFDGLLAMMADAFPAMTVLEVGDLKNGRRAKIDGDWWSVLCDSEAEDRLVA